MGGHHHGSGVEEFAAGDTLVHRLDPRVKIVGLIGLVVVTVSLPPGSWYAFGAVAAVLISLVVAARLTARHVLGRMTVEIPFLLAAAVIPFTVEDGLVLGGSVACKLTLSVLSMLVLSSTTPFPKLLRGFEMLKAPPLITLIVAFMWRYLHVLAEEVGRMRTSQAARGYSARYFWQALPSTGPLIATLFVRSLERGERVYLAMTSRGYEGVMPEMAADRFSLRAMDVAFVFCLAALLVYIRVVLP